MKTGPIRPNASQQADPSCHDLSTGSRPGVAPGPRWVGRLPGGRGALGFADFSGLMVANLSDYADDLAIAYIEARGR